MVFHAVLYFVYHAELKCDFPCSAVSHLCCAVLSYAVLSYRIEDGGIAAVLSPAHFSDHNYKIL